MSNSLKLVSAPVRESRLWDIPGYVPWFTADSATAIGVALRYLAVSLIGYKLTGSTTAAGWLGSLAAIAQQAAAPFGGGIPPWRPPCSAGHSPTVTIARH